MTNKYLTADSYDSIIIHLSNYMQDLQEVGNEITVNKCIHYGFQEFEIISRCWTGAKQTYSLLTARKIE